MYLLLNKNLNINRKLLHINIKYKNTYIQFINKYKYTIIISVQILILTTTVQKY